MRKLLAVGILIVGIWAFIPASRAVSAVSTKPCGQPNNPCPSPSPSPSPSAGPSLSPSPSPSASASPSPSDSPSPTRSPSQRPSPSGRPSQTAGPRRSPVHSLRGVPSPSSPDGPIGFIFRPLVSLSGPIQHPSPGPGPATFAAPAFQSPLATASADAGSQAIPAGGPPTSIASRGWRDPVVCGVVLFGALLTWAAFRYEKGGWPGR